MKKIIKKNILNTKIYNSKFEDDISDDCFLNEALENNSLPKKEIWKQHKSAVIDRNQEDKDILEFQKTGDMNLLEKLYKNRIPTLKIWASKHYYPGLTISQEDLFAELSVVFIKAAKHFNKQRGNFNTCLFNFLLNRIKNIKSGTHAKKRNPENYNGPKSAMTVSLDYKYSDDENSEMSLKDIIPDTSTTNQYNYVEDIIKVLSNGDTILQNFLGKISNGENISHLLKESKQKEGLLKINPARYKQIKKFNKRAIKKYIQESNLFNQEFELLDYKLSDLNLTFKVELKKTQEFEILSKAIKNFRKNKNDYIQKIKIN